MKKITLKESNPFFKELFEDWALISAKADERIGSMTISWGGIGYMWNKPVFYAVIRPQRFTKTIIDKTENFSISFLKDELKEKHKYFGTVSGHNEDKVAKSGMNISYSLETPYFEDSKKVYICKKMFAQPFDPANFIQKEHILKLYKDDYHTLYIAEILEVLQQD